jgi:hypothetical protein
MGRGASDWGFFASIARMRFVAGTVGILTLLA